MTEVQDFLWLNNAVTTLVADIAADATEITVQSGDGFPSPTGGEIVKLILEDPNEGAYEIMNLTARAGNVFTVERAREGTTAFAFRKHTKVRHGLTAEWLTLLVESAGPEFPPCIGMINGGAELGDMTGWTVTEGNMRVRVDEPDRNPPEGLNIFDGGTSAVSRARQRLDLSNSGFTNADIDAGAMQLIVDWWGGTFIQTPADQPQINVYFYDADLNLLDTYNSGLKDPTTEVSVFMRWDKYQETIPLPVGSRFIDVEMHAVRNNGINNDAAFDAICAHLDYAPITISLTNPGAEEGTLDGWTVTEGGWEASTERNPPVGSYAFWPGENASSRMYQRIDLLASNVAPSQIDDEALRIIVDWWGSSYTQSGTGGNDQPQLHIVFRDADLNVISTTSSGYKNPSTPSGLWLWDEYETSANIPAGTRYIDIECEALRSNAPGNTVNNASFDEIVPRIEEI